MKVGSGLGTLANGGSPGQAIKAGVGSGIFSLMRPGLEKLTSFTINAVQSTISPAGKLVGAIASNVYGQGESVSNDNIDWINSYMGIADPDDFSLDEYGQIIPNPGLDFSCVLPDPGFVERYRWYMKNQWSPPGREFFSVFSIPLSPTSKIGSSLVVGGHFGEKAMWSTYQKSFSSFSASRNFAYLNYSKPWAMTAARSAQVIGAVLWVPTAFYSGHDIGRFAVAIGSAWKD